MDGVGTPIIGRPRPLPSHDTPNPAHNTYTLKCEEPVWVKFYVAIHASETSSIVVLMFAPVTALMLLEVVLNDSGASMAVYSLFLLVPLACFISLELPAKQQNQIEMLG